MAISWELLTLFGKRTMDKCTLCGGNCKETGDGWQDDLRTVCCLRCGEYAIDEGLLDLDTLDEFIRQRLHLVSAVTRRMWGRGQRLRITRKLLQDRATFNAVILSQCPQGIQEKMNTILVNVADRSKCPGHCVTVVHDQEYPLGYCKNGLEMGFLLRSLQEQRLVDLHGDFGRSDVTLTADGWTKVEKLSRPNIDSRQAFVAMWFDRQLDPVYAEGIARLEQDTGFSMLRIDMKQFNDKICDQIITEIRRSRFLIADVTRHRRAVYFEAGYAMGLGLDVIWTCREDQVKKIGYNFDTRQYKHIVWTTPQDLREQLKYRILATIGKAGG